MVKRLKRKTKTEEQENWAPDKKWDRAEFRGRSAAANVGTDRIAEPRASAARRTHRHCARLAPPRPAAFRGLKARSAELRAQKVGSGLCKSGVQGTVLPL